MTFGLLAEADSHNLLNTASSAAQPYLPWLVSVVSAMMKPVMSA